MITRPLTRLLCKKATFSFDVECLEAFKKLKGELISAPIVQPPDWDLPFEIMCDASDYVVGAVLGLEKYSRNDLLERRHKVAPAGSDVTTASVTSRSALWRFGLEKYSRSDLLERQHEVAPAPERGHHRDIPRSLSFVSI